MSAITFLGLMEKAGRLEVGEETCASVVRAGKSKLLLTASDASDGLVSKARRLSTGYNVPIISLPFTKVELGNALGRRMAGIIVSTDAGMSAAFASKLETEFPGTCTEQLGELQKQAQRMAQRRKEAERHRSNLRHGKKGR